MRVRFRGDKLFGIPLIARGGGKVTVPRAVHGDWGEQRSEWFATVLDARLRVIRAPLAYYMYYPSRHSERSLPRSTTLRARFWKIPQNPALALPAFVCVRDLPLVAGTHADWSLCDGVKLLRPSGRPESAIDALGHCQTTQYLFPVDSTHHCGTIMAQSASL